MAGDRRLLKAIKREVVQIEHPGYNDTGLLAGGDRFVGGSLGAAVWWSIEFMSTSASE